MVHDRRSYCFIKISTNQPQIQKHGLFIWLTFVVILQCNTLPGTLHLGFYVDLKQLPARCSIYGCTNSCSIGPSAVWCFFHKYLPEPAWEMWLRRLGVNLTPECLRYEFDRATLGVLSIVFAVLLVRVVNLNRCVSGYFRS